ncbi:MAG: class I SAM-dependent methyltransferase [Candidatus Pacebacteria bacterium]|jgi:ubiquinone/menaquinone biosynthesis C-methylase UbiE|nr:class I SAM-dependent methyltransferase [Candidatus Paceibacterota bacterium]|tara:strand:- start:822 stop:1628 length:807 start_codon:yes stop_codon:yes gene_type:complete
MTKEEIKERWENYRKANSDKPDARENELSRVFELINPKEGEVIFEVGTGNGYLTLPLAQMIGESGLIVTADISQENLNSIKEKKADKKIETLLFSENTEQICPPEHCDKYDTVASIATFHHFDSRVKGTGESGRTKAVKEFHRCLKPGGNLVLADVAHNTISQKYFDAIDNPEYCYPAGHPHDFFTVNRLKEVVENIGFVDVKVQVEYVPWKFVSEDEAKDFIHTIHNAKCTEDESFEVAKEKLGFKKVNDHYELGWELFFLTANKPK